MPTPFQRIVALLLAVVLLLSSGCATARGPLAAVDGGGVTVATHAHGAHADAKGLDKTRHGGGKAAAWIFVGALLAVVVFVDLILLPVTYRDPFPCCQEVIHLCD